MGVHMHTPKTDAGYKPTGVGHRNFELNASKINESFPSSLPPPQLPAKLFSYSIARILINITSIFQSLF